VNATSYTVPCFPIAKLSDSSSSMVRDKGRFHYTIHKHTFLDNFR
jgi:hypothetical protein